METVNTNEVVITYNADFSLEDYQHVIIKFYLEKNKYKILQTAKELKIGKSTLYRLIQENPELKAAHNDAVIQQLYQRDYKNYD